ncbi:MAG: RraA family protein [Oribacterium sp.]|nr:RraA family protein [Oribacterium sp.]
MTAETKEIIDRLRTFTVPELCDGLPLYHVMDQEIKTRVGSTHIVGTAVTVDVPTGEGGIISDAILELSEGDILVIAGKGNCASSYWGDHRSLCAKMIGAEGVVVDGAFRDIEGCEAVGFPIFARGLTAGTALKSGTGAINVPVACGNQVVMPGDILCADRNGVLVMRPEEAIEAMKKALDKRKRQEATIQEMLETGKILTKVKKSL